MKDVDSELRVEDLVGFEEPLKRLARRLLTDEARAEDAVQETWLVALRHGPPGGDSLKWLRGILRNLARQTRRDEDHRLARERGAARRDSVPPAEEVIERAARHRELVDAVLGLGGHYSEVLLWRYFEDKPPRLIARHLGISVETVNTRLTRARAHLARELERRAGGREAWLSGMALIAFGNRSDVALLGSSAWSAKAVWWSVAVGLLAIPAVFFSVPPAASAPEVERAELVRRPEVSAPLERPVADEDESTVRVDLEGDLTEPTRADVAPTPAAKPAPVPVPRPEPAHFPYKERAGSGGAIRVVVSPYTRDLMQAWCAAYLGRRPNDRIDFVEADAEAARSSLLGETADLALQDYAPDAALDKRAVDAVEDMYGYRFLEFAAAHDLLAVVVHEESSSDAFFVEDLESAFPESGSPPQRRDLRSARGSGRLDFVVQAGERVEALLTSLAPDRAGSHALATVGAAQVLEAIAAQPEALGFLRGGLESPVYEGVKSRRSDGARRSYSTVDPNETLLAEAGVRLLPVRARAGKKTSLPTYDERLRYPLQRVLKIQVCYREGSELDGVRANLLRFVFSREGQALAESLGYVPVDRETADAALRAVGEKPYPKFTSERMRATREAESVPRPLWGGALHEALSSLDLGGGGG